MDHSFWIFIANLGLIGGVFWLRQRALKDPRRFWVFLLYGLLLGPRTDVKFMTKTLLLESGLRFVTWGLIFTSLFLGVGIILRTFFPPDYPPAFLMGFVFLFALFAGMGFVGGFYLFVRALFRSKQYVPPISKN